MMNGLLQKQNAQLAYEAGLSALPKAPLVWVILPDNGCEGLQEPIAVYQAQAQADRAMKLLENTGRTFRCVAIELW